MNVKKTKSLKKIVLKITMSMTMSCDCLVESRSDWSADRFEPLGYFEMWVENERRLIKGTSLCYRVFVNMFFPPTEWIDLVDLG